MFLNFQLKNIHKISVKLEMPGNLKLIAGSVHFFIAHCIF